MSSPASAHAAASADAVPAGLQRLAGQIRHAAHLLPAQGPIGV